LTSNYDNCIIPGNEYQDGCFAKVTTRQEGARMRIRRLAGRGPYNSEEPSRRAGKDAQQRVPTKTLTEGWEGPIYAFLRNEPNLFQLKNRGYRAGIQRVRD